MHACVGNTELLLVDEKSGSKETLVSNKGEKNLGISEY